MAFEEYKVDTTPTVPAQDSNQKITAALIAALSELLEENHMFYLHILETRPLDQYALGFLSAHCENIANIESKFQNAISSVPPSMSVTNDESNKQSMPEI